MSLTERYLRQFDAAWDQVPGSEDATETDQIVDGVYDDEVLVRDDA